ncbi:hypothetical protein WR25_04233 isoform B [Diploscapter pachys]|nr:hypothetical protein WR25_04233 isoform B [Diploscapter pachys]
MRVIQGIPTALSYTIQGMITNSWAGTKESGLYIAVMSTHVQWHRVFVGIAIIVILASTPFVFFADAKPAHYTLTPAPSQIQMQQMQKVLKSSDTRARQIEEFTKQSAMKHNQRVQLLSSSNKVLSPAAVDAAALAGYSPSDFPNPESPENGQKLTEDDKKFIEKMEKQTKLVNNVEAMAQKEMIMQNQLHPVSGASNVQNFRDPLLIPIYAAGLPNYPMPIHPELFYQPIGTSFGNRFSSQHGNIPSSDLGFMGQIPPDQNPNPENTKIWARPGNPEPESEQFQKLPIRNIEIEPPQEPKLAETDLEENIQREKLPSKEN